MTTKQTIEVEGLPEGWKLTKIKIPDGCTEKAGMNTISSHNIRGALFDLEKIQPRRIVLEETGDDNIKVDNEWCRQHFCKGLIIAGQPKLWREVKENDIPLNNNEPNLSLSLEQCKKFFNGAITDRLEVFQLVEDFLKENS